MKLAEAKALQTRLEYEVKGCELKLLAVPKDTVGQLLDQLSDLLNSIQVLRRRIRTTEDVVALGGSTLTEVNDALFLLEEKVRVMEILSVNSKLDASQHKGIEEQLLSYRSTRDSLRLNIDKCNWETDLLDE